jgi:predicted lipid-binding transport protein (Tim44 family)
LRHSSTKSSFPAGNPIANVLVIIVGALAIGASIVLGFFAFIALSGIILVTAAIIGIRVWWFKRKLRQGSPLNDASRGPKSADRVIEGEYQVIQKDRGET